MPETLQYPEPGMYRLANLVFITAEWAQRMEISVGHTPDSDDAFMFYGMFGGRIPDAGFTLSHVIEDIETLNRRAAKPALDVTAVSVHACAYAPGYTILRSGGSFGLNYGPIVTARREMEQGELGKCTIAVPGRMTSAFLLLQLMIGRFRYVEMNFAEIPSAVRNGTVDVGLVIHETQLSHVAEGNTRVLDLGRWWNDATGGLPVPLGINVMRTDLGADTIGRFDRYLQDSIKYGMAHFEDALEYAMRYGRGRPRELIARFVRMYVNASTVDMGTAGEASIRKLFEMAQSRDLVPDFELRFAPSL